LLKIGESTMLCARAMLGIVPSNRAHRTEGECNKTHLYVRVHEDDDIAVGIKPLLKLSDSTVTLSRSEMTLCTNVDNAIYRHVELHYRR